MILIQFCRDEELELLIPYEYHKGILSVERMREIANDLLKLSQTLTNEEINCINQRDRDEEIAELERQRQEFLRLPKGRKPKSGVVYLIKADDTNRYKIGCTSNLKARLKALEIKNPYKLEVIHTIPSNDIEALEKALHDQFAQYRTHSEWFELTQGAIMEFCSYVDGTAV